MSEVMGSLVIEPGSEDVRTAISAIDESADADVFNTVFSVLGIPALDADLDIEVEEVGENLGYIHLSLFGEDWVVVIRHLFSADEIRFWAKLWNEDGIDYYFALLPDRSIDRELPLESGNFSDEEIEAIESEWLSTMPESVKAIFQSD